MSSLKQLNLKYFKKESFTSASSTNLLLQTVHIEAGHYLLRVFIFSTQIWLFSGLKGFFKEVRNKEKFSDNLAQILWRHYKVLLQFTLAASETGIDNYHEIVNIRVALQVSEWLEQFLEHLKKIFQVSVIKG